MPKQVPRAWAYFMSSKKHRSRNPYKTTAKFISICGTCGQQIKMGETIIVWPNSRTAGHEKCDDESFTRSMEAIYDEDVLMVR